MRTATNHRMAALVVTIVAGLLVGTIPAQAGGGRHKLPKAVRQAVNQAFPDAKIKSVDREREKDVRYYSLELKWQHRELDVEVAPDGALGEVEERVDRQALPAAVAAGIEKLVGTGKLRMVERHEIHGIPQKGTFRQLPMAQVVYEAKVSNGGKRLAEYRLDAAGKLLAPEDEDDDDGEDGEQDDD